MVVTVHVQFSGSLWSSASDVFLTVGSDSIPSCVPVSGPVRSSWVSCGSSARLGGSFCLGGISKCGPLSITVSRMYTQFSFVDSVA